MTGDKSQATTNSQQIISLAAADPNTLDAIFQTLRDNQDMASQSHANVVSVSTLLLGLSAVPVALALGSLALPTPGKSLPTSWGVPNLAVSSGVVLAVVVVYGLALIVYLPFVTVVPTLRLARIQIDITTESVRYALAEPAEKRIILEGIIQRVPRRYLAPRSYQISFSNLAATYALGLSYLLFVLAALISLFVILSHIPAN